MRKLAYAIVFVSDMKRSLDFYRDVLGLPLKFESPGWTEFSTEGATVALHAAGRTPAGNCHPGIHVDNLEEFHKIMMAKGVRCIQPPQEQFGAKLAVYADPDGLPFTIGEARK